MPKLPTSSSKDSLPESLQMSLNPSMQWDTMPPSRKHLKLPRPLYSLTHLLQLKEPKLLQAAIETEEQCLYTYCHLLEEMHCIDLSSVKTMEEMVVEVITEEIRGAIATIHSGRDTWGMMTHGDGDA